MVVGEMSDRETVWSGKFPSGKCLVGKVSVGEVSVGDVSVGEVSIGDVSGNPDNNIGKIKSSRLKCPNNPLISYLNINSLRNKIVDVREVIKLISPDYFVVAETNLMTVFPLLNLP